MELVFMNYDISEFGSNIVSGSSTEKIVRKLLELLDDNDVLCLDFKNINVMTTTATKEILKPIVDKYGIEHLFKKIHFCNVAEDLKIVISTAIDGL